ncbi:O-antigen ligase family protein [Glaciihabitans sp. UYNi722]|uniref:O-antigen ligase family protein n=1 Tax=Glaciihabitans sp. UYNi722 TaxID=3156344 RepID=UPI003398BA40
MSKLDSRGLRLGFAALALFTGLAGDFWRNALSWYGYGIMVAIVVAGTVVLLVHNRGRFRWASLPYPLLGFLLFSGLSIAWSFYPLFTTLGVFVQWITATSAVSIAVTLSWAELLTALGWALRFILGLSFIFEFIVSVFIRQPIYPVWLVEHPAHPAKLLYWSRDLLFSGGKIQGIIGNSSLLAMVALLAVIVFAIQLASRNRERRNTDRHSVSRLWGWFWMVVAVLTIAITKSATIFVGLGAVVVVALAVLLIRQARTRRGRVLTYGGIGIGVVAIAALGFVLRNPILGILGKSEDFTGRFTIWDAVIGLAQQRPAFGWGWLGYWIPWIPPFKGLVRAGGVQVMHAHDAWLDVWLQVGIVGLVIFAALTLSTLVRSWIMAADRIVTTPGSVGHHSWLALLPLLMLVAQLVQSIAESRMLLEGGWMLLVLWAVKTKLSPMSAEFAVTGQRGS